MDAASHGQTMRRRPDLPGRAFVWLQRVLPTLLLSALAYRVTRSQSPRFKRWLIGWFMRRFDVSLGDARLRDADAYVSFNHFFTRALRDGARPIAETPEAVISPVDGTVSEAGIIRQGRLVQAKGIDYAASDLLGVDEMALGAFLGGQFATLYLSPRDYHRIHMPLDGRLKAMHYRPGRLFSVNPTTVRHLPGLFTRNERLTLLFDTDAGPFALVMVGAIFVGSLETRWTGLLTPPHGGRPFTQTVRDDVVVHRGEEIGRFNMGSTVILLSGAGVLDWNDDLRPGAIVRMGASIATRTGHFPTARRSDSFQRPPTTNP